MCLLLTYFIFQMGIKLDHLPRHAVTTQLDDSGDSLAKSRQQSTVSFLCKAPPLKKSPKTIHS